MSIRQQSMPKQHTTDDLTLTAIQERIARVRAIIEGLGLRYAGCAFVPAMPGDQPAEFHARATLEEWVNAASRSQKTEV